MVLETAQLLSTAHRELGSPFADQCYKSTHGNHPSAKWTRLSSSNYGWLWDHFVALSDEYTHRFRREHKTWIDKFAVLENNPSPKGPLTVPLVAVSDDLKPHGDYGWDDAVLAYRRYYRRDKADLTHRYTNRERPSWLV